MPTMTVTTGPERITKPWEGTYKSQRGDTPFEKRHWWADVRTGRLVMHEETFDHDTGESTGIKGAFDQIAGAATRLSHQDVEAIYEICRKFDCTFMDAVIKHVGVDRLPKAWVQDALRAPKVYYTHAEQQMKIEAPPEIPWVDPEGPPKDQAAPPTAQEQVAEAMAKPDRATLGTVLYRTAIKCGRDWNNLKKLICDRFNASSWETITNEQLASAKNLLETGEL